jgi:hypothetical protein
MPLPGLRSYPFCGVGYLTVGSMISTEERKIRSPAKAMPSVWNVGKFSFSLLVCCQAVLRSTAPKAVASAVSRE